MIMSRVKLNQKDYKDVFNDINNGKYQMEVIFLEPAESELKEAVRYYNEQSEELGYEFAQRQKRLQKELFKSPTLGRKCQKELADADVIDFLTV